MMEVSIIVPTYNEAKNLPLLIEEILLLINKSKISLEFIVVDDNSPDGTGSVAEDLAMKWPIRVIHRSGKMGLGTAVVEGFKASTRPYVGVMDADLSHDPVILNELILSLENNDLAIGSRFSEGSTVENWHWWRRAISNMGVFFAKRITKVKDPLSGYFFLPRRTIENVKLKTKGYKILLEILVKAKPHRIKEVAFTFRMRKFSSSKLSPAEYLLFFGQLIKYSGYSLYVSIRTNKDKQYFLLVLIISAFLLFFRIGSRSFWMDEQAVLEYLYHAPSPFNFLVNYFHVPDNHPPLYYFLVIAIYKILPLGELGIRLVSVLAGLGLIIVLYYFSLLFFESRAQARLAMFFTAISSYFILISQMARYHSLAALWTLLSLYFFCKITIVGYTKRNLACFLVFALLLAYTDLPHFIYLITITNFFYFYKWLRNAKIIELKTWFGSQLGLLVLFLPVIYMFYLRVFNQNDKGFEKESLLGGSIIDRIADFLMHIYAYFFGENIFPWNYVPFLAGVLILGMLLVVLLKAAYDKRLTKNFYLLLYLVLSLLVLNTIFLNYADPRYNFIVFPKYAFAAFPFFIMLLSALIFQIRSKKVRYGVVILWALVSGYGLQNFFRATNYINGSYFNDFKSYRFVQDNARVGDYLIINGDANIGLYNFYKDNYFKNLTPIPLADISAVQFSKNSRLWFFATGSDGDSLYPSAGTQDKIPSGFTVLSKFESVPIDKELLILKRKITGRQSYNFKYGVYLLIKS